MVGYANPVYFYHNEHVDYGSGYCSTEYNGKLYLGTNQGLYVSQDDELSLIKGSQGQVWNVSKVGSTLFCCHNRGLFLVDQNDSLHALDCSDGVWSVSPLNDKSAIVGSYNGFYYLFKDSKSWQLKYLNGFSETALNYTLDENNNIEVKKELFSCIDLTSLKCTDSEESIMKLTEKVNEFVDKYPDLSNVAAICVYPNMAEIVSDTLEADDVKIACVAGGFPSSQTFTEVKVAETAMAIHTGAEEIDIVIPVGKFLCGDYEGMCDEIGELKDVCGEKPLKVILETGALMTASNIKKAAILAMYSGADFIKTSTGKEAISATPEAALVMCEAIREYYQETGRKVGFKAAGGIDTVKKALAYYTIVKEVLGEEWLNNGLFRIGTSRLANLLLSDITGEEIKFF